MKGKPYTYSLKFKPTGQYYYGVRYAKGCNPSDLFVSYFTSSKTIRRLIHEYGTESFEYKVRKIFDNRKDAIEWETKFQTKVKADRNAKFLNKSIWKVNFDSSGLIWLYNENTKIQVLHDPSIKIPEGFAVGFSNEHRENISKSRKGKTASNKGKKCKPTGPCSDERRKNISDSRKTTKKIDCIFCGTQCDPGNYKRFHGDNCKSNPNVSSESIERRSEIAKKSMKTQKENGTYKVWKKLSGPFICNVCGKIGSNYGAMKRFHFENCKTS